MKYKIENLKKSVSDNTSMENYLKNKYHIEDFKYKIISKSIDARDKAKVMYIYKIMLETDTQLKLEYYKEQPFNIKYPKYKGKRPVIVGFGPAGMFAALYLARCNAKPIIIERGSSIEQRKKDVDNFIKNKVLNPNSNIQFGEGGAGTFSDGKLVTNVKDPLINFIINEFYIHGAKEEILYESKPHIGTDYLEIVVKNIRKEIISLGGEFYFNTKFVSYKKNLYDLEIKAINNKNNDEYKFITDKLLLGLGHSARDTIKELYNNGGLFMEPKSFSMGVRVEHNAKKINEAQYGKAHVYLPTAYYKLSCHNDGRGIYTFCMCPGGYIMASASEEGSIVTNGMSNEARDNENSNSAILVDVRPDDYYKNSVLDGLDYQEKYEKLAYSLSNDYRAPANLFKEFLDNEVAKNVRSIKPSYPHSLNLTDLSLCLPDYVISGIKYGIKEFDRKVKGFNDPDAILVGVETRSSSPVRILRDENRMSNIKGIYPIGEGAGYAGGITSAALDGLKTAMNIVKEVAR